jgi:hypothetical protein
MSSNLTNKGKSSKDLPSINGPVAPLRNKQT